MTVSRRLILLLVAVGAVVCRAQTAPVMTPADYRAELDRLITTTKQLDESRRPEIPNLLSTIPSSWHIQIEDRKFDISAEWLRSDLRKLQEKFDPQLRERIDQRLENLRTNLDGYLQAPPDTSAERARLAGILARREFSGVHGPTLIDRLKQRLLRFLINLLTRFFGSRAIPTVGKVFVYSLIGLAVVLLAIWVYRAIRRGSEMERILPEELPVSAKEWTLWMAEAREAAARGNWRDAIHLAYWAGISFLEARGMWRPDRARTPREYLRLLPSYSEYQGTLTSLTRNFERVWYGYQEADAQAYAQTLQELEKLGCRSN
jgi:hypothetical protein